MYSLCLRSLLSPYRHPLGLHFLFSRSFRSFDCRGTAPPLDPYLKSSQVRVFRSMVICFLFDHTTLVLRISCSSTPDCVEADCWNWVCLPPPLPPGTRNTSYSLCYTASVILNSGLISKNTLLLHNDIPANFRKSTIPTQRYHNGILRTKIQSIKMTQFCVTNYVFKQLRQNRPYFLCFSRSPFILIDDNWHSGQNSNVKAGQLYNIFVGHPS